MANFPTESLQASIVLGKLIFRQLESCDLPKLVEFCGKCKDLNFHNNTSLEVIKYEKMVMPFGKFFVGVDTEKDIIFSLAGVHRFPEVNENAWRCLFRGAQLPGYNTKFSKNMFDIAYHFSYMLYLQIGFVRSIFPNSEFYITTNIDDNNNGFSGRVNRIMMPHVEKTDIWKLYRSDVLVYNTLQNIWKINTEEYFTQRLLWQQSYPN
jgi:hypothetical protein